MPLPFDTNKEDAQLRAIHEHEEEDVADILSTKYGLQYLDLSATPIDTDALRVITEEDARGAQVVAFLKNGKKLSLALANPNNTNLPPLEATLSAEGYTTEKFLVSAKSLERALERYAELSYATKSRAGVFDISGDDLSAMSAKLKNIPAVKALLEEIEAGKKVGELSTLFEAIFAGAFALKASDIHLEPGEDGTRLRLRLDGILMDVTMFDEHTYRQLSSRIKLLAGLKLNVANRAQDGRFSVPMKDYEIEIRVSLVPGNYGESFVLRVLDPKAVETDVNKLSMHPKLRARLLEEIKRPNGMLLTTGPTGSGKTTTLYAFLRHIYTPDIKIITIEDPIEYHLAGITQTQTDGDKYTFASGLRSIVRQDPDVIMVGEIRDGETANIAIEAALTGHFVYSTLHTNDAAGTFPRLVDLGADPKTFSSAITIAMGQRLVRTLNSQTKRERPLTDAEKTVVDKILATVEDKSLLPATIATTWEAVPNGTDDTGYQGREGLYEAIFMDDAIGTYLRDNPSEGDIAKEARKQGYLTMVQDGVLKALAGTTTLEEVFSVVGVPRE